MPCALAEKFAFLLPGMDPWSLFLSNRSSTRVSSLPSSGGTIPVSPFEWRFLEKLKKKQWRLN